MHSHTCIHGHNWPVVYGSYTLEYNCHIHDHSVHSGQMVVFTAYTTSSAFDLLARYSTNVVVQSII